MGTPQHGPSDNRGEKPLMLDREHGDKFVAFPGLPEDLRWRVMVLGSSVEDMNFWVRRRDEDGGRWYLATEIETGVTVVDAREALDNYFKNE